MIRDAVRLGKRGVVALYLNLPLAGLYEAGGVIKIQKEKEAMNRSAGTGPCTRRGMHGEARSEI